MESELEIVRRHMALPPVNVAAIFSELGVDYIERPLPEGESGRIEWSDGHFTVTVNASEGRQRRRFTAAHELAHYLMHRDILLEHGRMNRHVDMLFGEDAMHSSLSPLKRVHEVQANKMAAQIIMPASHVQSAWDELKDSAAVAARFGVSKAAMDIRLDTLRLPQSA